MFTFALDNKRFVPLSFCRFLFLSLIAICLLAPVHQAEAADVYGLQMDAETGTIDSGEQVSTSTTGADNAYGASLDNTSTLTNLGSISVTSESGYSLAVRGDRTSTLTNSGSISATSKSDVGSGVRVLDHSTLINSGSISGTSKSSEAFGARAYNTSTLINSGSISGTSESGSAYGARALNSSTLTNSGSILGTSESGEAYGVYVGNFSTLTNSGTISASGRSNSYAIFALNHSTVNLLTGTQILHGSVHGSNIGTASTLNITSDSDLDFALTGVWGAISHSGSGIWGMSSGTNATATSLTLGSGSTMAMSMDSSLVVSGTATLNGAFLVEPSATNLGATTTLLSANILTQGANYRTGSINPNFNVTVNTTGTTTTATVNAFDPQDDESSLAASATLSSARAFAGVGQTRSLILLADAKKNGTKDEILLASNGSLAGIGYPLGRERKWGMFVQPVYSSASRDGDINSEGYDSDMVGMEVGVDRHYGTNLVFGAMAGIGTSNIDFKGSPFVDNNYDKQKLYTAGIYTGYRKDDWLFSDTLSLTYGSHDSSRYAGLGETAVADYDSWLTTNQLLVMYEWNPTEQWTVAPRVGLNVSYFHRDAFSETKATNAVSYEDLDTFFADGILGVRASHLGYIQEDTMIIPYFGVGMVHSLGDNDITVRQYIANTSAQVITQNDSDRLTSECGISITEGTTSFTFAYKGEYGDTTDVHTFFGTLRLMF